MWNFSKPGLRTGLLFLAGLTLGPAVMLSAQDTGKEYVTIYEDFDEGQFGRSEKRSSLRGVRLDLLKTTGSFEVRTIESPGTTDSWLTAVVLSADTAEKLRTGEIPLERSVVRDPSTGTERIIYLYDKDGIRIRFSLEKPPAAMLEMIRKHYQNDLRWKDPVIQHYSANFVIRIHTAENALDPWIEEITYGDVLLSATLIGDRDQWLWGIHDGNDLLRRSIHQGTTTQKTPPPFIED